MGYYYQYYFMLMELNGKANVTPVMLTLGWYSEKLFKQDI